MAGYSKDVGKLLKTLQAKPYSCSVRPMKSGHWRVMRSGHQPITVAKSPSDRRAWDNIVGDVRRYLGVDYGR